jgi:hypothetical protein
MRRKIQQFRRFLAEQRRLVESAEGTCGVRHVLQPAFPCTQRAGHTGPHVNAKGGQWESLPSNTYRDDDDLYESEALTNHDK